MLYHYAEKMDKESILKHGFIRNYTMKKGELADYSDTIEINPAFIKYKPKEMPEFIDRTNCIYFFMEERKYLGQSSCHLFKVNPMELDLEKLYIANHNLAHKVWTIVVDVPYSGDEVDYTLEEVASEYWNSMVKYKDFINNPTIPLKDVEVLYFADIPKERINGR